MRQRLELKYHVYMALHARVPTCIYVSGGFGRDKSIVFSSVMNELGEPARAVRRLVVENMIVADKVPQKQHAICRQLSQVHAPSSTQVLVVISDTPLPLVPARMRRHIDSSVVFP